MTRQHDRNPTLDPLIHEAARLLIVSVLNECDTADFNFMLHSTDLTRGNLSKHMAKLVQAGYVEEHKHYLNRKPHTEYRLTRTGQAAFRAYRKAWRRLTNDSTR